tara:strand:- start:262 stop:1248 length:987 start_codon:yes stop_codon:yes gene_type:complete
MGFLDNSGDIILDAVLTDTGRMRLARGDGSFKIVKFALGDDEINYELYRNSNHANGAHASGSAYYDLDILQTPVLEAFTNNTSLMKSKLISVPRTNLLYLPILKLNEARGDFARNTTAAQANGFFAITVDTETSRAHDASTTPGIFETTNGTTNGITGDGTIIRVDQGLDSSDLSPRRDLDSDLVETQYIIEMDNRLGTIVPPGASAERAAAAATPAFIDDDNIAAYNLSLRTDTSFIKRNTSKETKGSGTPDTIEGPRGTILQFKIKSSIQLQDSNKLFERIGTKSSTWTPTGKSAVTIHYIDTIVRVTGGTTGYRIDIPVRFVKKA